MDSAISSPSLMKFGNDVVVSEPSSTNTQNYTVLNSDMAKQDYLNKQNFLDQESKNIIQQSLTNQANKQTQTQASSEMGTIQNNTDALKKATDALSEGPAKAKTASGNEYDVTGDNFTDSLAGQNADLAAMYKQTQEKLSIASTTAGLSADQKTSLQSLSDNWDALIKTQEQANKFYEGGITTSTVRNGTSRYAGDIAMGNVKYAIDQGLQKIADLTAKKTDALTKMRQGFISDNVKIVNDAYKSFTDYNKQVTDNIKEMHQAVMDAHKMALDDQKYNLDVYQQKQKAQQDARDFVAKHNITQPFYMLGGYLFNSVDGSLISDPEQARKLGVADDLSNVSQVDTAEHSSAYKEWQDYQSTGGKLDFNAYMDMDANRHRSVTNIYNSGDYNPKELQAVKGIIEANPREYGKAADAIDEKFGKGTAARYDALLKQSYLLPSRAQELLNDPRISTMTTNQIKDLRNKFIQDNGYVDPDVAGKAFDDVVGKGVKSNRDL